MFTCIVDSIVDPNHCQPGHSQGPWCLVFTQNMNQRGSQQRRARFTPAAVPTSYGATLGTETGAPPLLLLSAEGGRVTFHTTRKLSTFKWPLPQRTRCDCVGTDTRKNNVRGVQRRPEHKELSHGVDLPAQWLTAHQALPPIQAPKVSPFC